MITPFIFSVWVLTVPTVSPVDGFDDPRSKILEAERQEILLGNEVAAEQLLREVLALSELDDADRDRATFQLVRVLVRRGNTSEAKRLAGELSKRDPAYDAALERTLAASAASPPTSVEWAHELLDDDLLLARLARLAVNPSQDTFAQLRRLGPLAAPVVRSFLEWTAASWERRNLAQLTAEWGLPAPLPVLRSIDPSGWVTDAPPESLPHLRALAARALSENPDDIWAIELDCLARGSIEPTLTELTADERREHFPRLLRSAKLRPLITERFKDELVAIVAARLRAGESLERNDELVDALFERFETAPVPEALEAYTTLLEAAYGADEAILTQAMPSYGLPPFPFHHVSPDTFRSQVAKRWDPLLVVQVSDPEIFAEIAIRSPASLEAASIFGHSQRLSSRSLDPSAATRAVARLLDDPNTRTRLWLWSEHIYRRGHIARLDLDPLLPLLTELAQSRDETDRRIFSEVVESSSSASPTTAVELVILVVVNAMSLAQPSPDEAAFDPLLDRDHRHNGRGALGHVIGRARSALALRLHGSEGRPDESQQQWIQTLRTRIALELRRGLADSLGALTGVDPREDLCEFVADLYEVGATSFWAVVLDMATFEAGAEVVSALQISARRQSAFPLPPNLGHPAGVIADRDAVVERWLDPSAPSDWRAAITRLLAERLGTTFYRLQGEAPDDLNAFVDRLAAALGDSSLPVAERLVLFGVLSRVPRSSVTAAGAELAADLADFDATIAPALRNYSSDLLFTLYQHLPAAERNAMLESLSRSPSPFGRTWALWPAFVTEDVHPFAIAPSGPRTVDFEVDPLRTRARELTTDPDARVRAAAVRRLIELRDRDGLLTVIASLDLDQVEHRPIALAIAETLDAIEAGASNDGQR